MPRQPGNNPDADLLGMAGLSDRAAAQRLGVAPSTVNRRRQRLKAKTPAHLGAANRPQSDRRVVCEPTRPSRVLFVSDLHVPFHDSEAWECLLGLARDFRPQLVILGGDLFDCYSISEHQRDPTRAAQVQDEYDAGRPLWGALRDAVRGAKTIVIEGNHEHRMRRHQLQNPGLFRLRALELPRAAEMPPEWHYYPNQTRIKLGSVSFLHGDLRGRGGGAKHIAKNLLDKLRTTVVFGHHHKFQDFYETHAGGVVRAGFATGHLCHAPDMDYVTEPDWQQGFRTFEFAWPSGVFSARSHLIIDGRLVCDGRLLPQRRNRAR